MASKKRQPEETPEPAPEPEQGEAPGPSPATAMTMVEAMRWALPETIPEGPGVLFEYTYGGSPRWVFMDVDHLSVHAAIAAAKEAKPGATPEELISALGGLVGDRGRLFRRVSVIKL